MLSVRIPGWGYVGLLNPPMGAPADSWCFCWRRRSLTDWLGSQGSEKARYPWSLGVGGKVGEELLPLLFPLATGIHPELIGHAPPKQIAFMKS